MLSESSTGAETKERRRANAKRRTYSHHGTPHTAPEPFFDGYTPRNFAVLSLHCPYRNECMNTKKNEREREPRTAERNRHTRRACHPTRDTATATHSVVTAPRCFLRLSALVLRPFCKVLAKSAAFLRSFSFLRFLRPCCTSVGVVGEVCHMWAVTIKAHPRKAIVILAVGTRSFCIAALRHFWNHLSALLSTHVPMLPYGRLYVNTYFPLKKENRPIKSGFLRYFADLMALLT